MKTNPRSGKAAFTLIELMAVITIIVILAGLVVGGMGFVNERQAKEKARVQIALLSKALEDYKLDIGSYPITPDSTNGLGNTAEILYGALYHEGYSYKALTTPPTTWVKAVGNNNAFPKSTSIYLTTLDPTTSAQGWMSSTFLKKATPPNPAKTPPESATTITDPWGKEYRYRSGAAAPSTAGPAVNPNTQNPDFDLWSSGKDGATNDTLSSKECRDDVRQ